MKCQLAKICRRFQNIKFDNKKKCIQPFIFSYLAKNPKIGNTEKKANGLEEEKKINLPRKNVEYYCHHKNSQIIDGRISCQ